MIFYWSLQSTLLILYWNKLHKKKQLPQQGALSQFSELVRGTVYGCKYHYPLRMQKLTHLRYKLDKPI